MDCNNFVAFIQVAVAFDFGLLFLKDSHILRKFHNDLLTELKNRKLSTLNAVSKLIKFSENKKDFHTRVNREYLNRASNILTAVVDPKQANWDKYTYLGVFSGIYGLICLLVMGMYSTPYGRVVNDFLLVLNQLFLISEILIVKQFSTVPDGQMSSYCLLRNSIWFVVIVVGMTLLITLTGFVWRIFPNFEMPFICGSTAVAYFPVIIYLIKVYLQCRKATVADKECKNQIKVFGGK